ELRPRDAKAPRVLIVLDRNERDVWKSFRNLGDRVRIVLPEELNTYDVLLSDWLIFSKETLEATNARLSGSESVPRPTLESTGPQNTGVQSTGPQSSGPQSTKVEITSTATSVDGDDR